MADLGSQPAVVASSDIQPKYDNFYTPANGDFYSTFKYEDLRPQDHIVRLVKLLPDCGNGMIECELLDQLRLADMHGKYSALSYCAGNPHKTKPILISGTPFNVFRNLNYALIEARHFWTKTQPNHDEGLLLWVDQICINQSNSQERSHQVGFMRDIYQHAKEVLVCLSSSPGSPGSGLRWLNRLYGSIRTKSDLERRYQNELQNPHAAIHIPVEELEHALWSQADNDLEGWLGFFDLLRDPWWRRAWVQQEFFVNKHARFLCDRASISWHRMSSLFPPLFLIHASNESIRVLDLESRLNITSHGISTQSLETVIQYYQSSNAYSAINRADLMLQTKISQSGPSDLKALLEYSKFCESSDPRDRIYAFIGLADPRYSILPDYAPSNTLANVLIETTRKIMLYEENLDALLLSSAADRPLRAQLPSWVVDWSSRTKATSQWWDHPFYRASNNTLANPIFLHDSEGKTSKLILTGILVDTVETLKDQTSFYDRTFTSWWTKERFSVSSATVAGVKGGDQIWVLYGARIPFILRPQGSDHILIHPANVSIYVGSGEEIMTGGIVDKVSTGVYKTSQVSLI